MGFYLSPLPRLSLLVTTVIAPAKMNLGLEVLYQRPDGYHEISTLFYRVSEPHDTITVTNAGFFRLTCSDASLPVDERNLMIRAANAFEQMTGNPLPPLLIHLEKHIPMGAGLGGGSSDAAAMLKILYDNSQTPPSLDDMMQLAAKIGADVPFFLHDIQAASARGIGEKLTPVEAHLPAAMLIVFDPTIHVSTREAYASLSPTPRSASMDYARFFAHTPPLKTWKEALRNDFEPEIFRRYPRLAEIKHALYLRGAGFALMSGSGSAIYGLFENVEIAQRAKQLFESEGLLAFLN
jgi:4-diphosphocytidyl-2-C-methyl-D-erythritol kinase